MTNVWREQPVLVVPTHLHLLLLQFSCKVDAIPKSVVRNCLMNQNSNFIFLAFEHRAVDGTDGRTRASVQA
jgi:hypothetical protein